MWDAAQYGRLVVGDGYRDEHREAGHAEDTGHLKLPGTIRLSSQAYKSLLFLHAPGKKCVLIFLGQSQHLGVGEGRPHTARNMSLWL